MGGAILCPSGSSSAVSTLQMGGAILCPTSSIQVSRVRRPSTVAEVRGATLSPLVSPALASTPSSGEVTRGTTSSQAREPSGLPVCGFVCPLPSPYHFGGIPPSPTTHTSCPVFPSQTSEEGGGLPVLDIPDVAKARSRWLTQFDKLAAANGADRVLLARVREMVASGVRCEFKSGPPSQIHHQNTRTFASNEPECLERMRVYEHMGAMRRVAGLPPVGSHVQPLHAVVKPGKKARVCFDLARNFNDFLVDETFHMATIQDSVDLALQAGKRAWFAKQDISACFLSFPIHSADLHFFYCQAGGDFYQFLALVFGRKDAPRVTTYLLNVVSAALTDAGVPHVRYLDDFFYVATTKDRAWACAYTAAMVIKEFGLALSLPKAEGPFQRIEFLGIIIDSVKETLEISEVRRLELVGLLQAFTKRKDSSVIRLQSLLGKLAFASTVLPGARPFTRRIIDTLAGKAFGTRRLTPAFKADCRYWLAHMSDWNGTARWRTPVSTPFVFASDASTSGFGYGLESCSPAQLRRLPAGMRPGDVRAGTWSWANGDAMRQRHSAEIQWGEFFAPLAAAVEFGERLRDSHVVFIIDNESDTHVINRLRSRDQRVAALLRCLCDTARRHNFSFEAVHRMGVDNVLMDWASRPDLHKFAAWQAGSRLGGECGGMGLSLYPPLLIPTSVLHISSHCLKFELEASWASWRSGFAGLRRCARSCI
jgi:hypothetical protein